MPTREFITGEMERQRNGGRKAADDVRRKYIKKLHQLTGRDTVLYFSAAGIPRPFPVPQQAVAVANDDVQGFMASLHGLKGDKLDLMLHSPGGSPEAADQIVQYLRAKYNDIRVIVPQYAMSAATMIACAADCIVMGKHSAIGPIDPQLPIGGRMMPAQAILDEFEVARNEVAQDPKLANLWASRFTSLPPGSLMFCHQAIALGKEKVRTWLASYMFKGKDDQKANEIADWLGEFKEHKTHGRPIGYDLAEKKGLQVVRLEDDQRLQEAVLSVFHAAMLTFETTHCMKLIENHNGKGHFLVATVQLQVAAPQAEVITN